MTKTINQNIMPRDYSISLIRFISMIFIIACHILQYFSIELAFWFNVGVQIFLCISGFLYGKKQEINDIQFLKKNFIKISLSYYLVIIPFSIVGLCLGYVTIIDIFSSLLCSIAIKGGEHLWFIPTILICYFLTPFLSRFFNNEDTNLKSVLKLLFILVAIAITFTIFVPYFNPAWISCYVIGFYLSKIQESQNKIQLSKIISFIIVVLAVCCNALQITIDYILECNFANNYLSLLYNVFCTYSHALLGIALFIVFKKLFAKVKENKFLKYSDKFSYEIYLVHQFFILGPLSIFKYTNSIFLSILIILLATIILAILIKYLADLILSKFNKAK